jgi:hypothetical protein
MRILADYDPLSGFRSYITTEGDKLHVTNEQPTEAILQSAADLRNRPDYSNNGIKNDMWHYARVPDYLFLEIEQKYGVSVTGANKDWPAFFAILNRDYPHFKVTDKTHA